VLPHAMASEDFSLPHSSVGGVWGALWCRQVGGVWCRQVGGVWCGQVHMSDSTGLVEWLEYTQVDTAGEDKVVAPNRASANEVVG
jgi:hypothetical protein